MANMNWKEKRANAVYRQMAELEPIVQEAVIDKLKNDGLLQAVKQIGKTRTVLFGDLYPDVIEKQKTFAVFEGLATGLKYFDDATLGLRKGETIVVAGPSNLGKTMVCLNILTSCVVTQKAKVLIISMEMPALDIASRIYNMTNYHDELMENVVIQTQMDVNCKHIAAMIERHKPDLVMIDHIQFLANQEKGFGEFEKINVAIKKVQRLATQYMLPIIVISHVAKTRSGKAMRASASDLKGSSSIEQDTDIVFMLNRDGDQRKSGQLEIELVKHRKKGSPLYFKPCLLQFNGVRLGESGSYDFVEAEKEKFEAVFNWDKVNHNQ